MTEAYDGRTQSATITAVNFDGETVSLDPYVEPWSVVAMALGYQARGMEMTDEQRDAVELAATGLAAAALVQGGMSENRVIAVFESQGDYDIKLSYDGPTRAFGITIEWVDGELAGETMEVAQAGTGPNATVTATTTWRAEL
jgi:hypothetical protein